MVGESVGTARQTHAAYTKSLDPSPLSHTFYVPSLCAPRLCTYSTLRPQGSENPAEELRCVLAVIRHGDRTPKQVRWKGGGM